MNLLNEQERQPEDLLDETDNDQEEESEREHTLMEGTNMDRHLQSYGEERAAKKRSNKREDGERREEEREEESNKPTKSATSEFPHRKI